MLQHQEQKKKSLKTKPLVPEASKNASRSHLGQNVLARPSLKVAKYGASCDGSRHIWGSVPVSVGEVAHCVERFRLWRVGGLTIHSNARSAVQSSSSDIMSIVTPHQKPISSLSASSPLLASSSCKDKYC